MPSGGDPRAESAVSGDAAPTLGGRLRQLGRNVRAVEELGVLLALIAMVTVISIVHPEFIEIQSISNLLQQASYYGIIALGMVFMLSLGEVDLSVGGNMAFTSLCAALFVKGGMDPWVAVPLTLAIGMGLGIFNATVANVFGLPLIIVTLGTLSMYRGLTLVVSGGEAVAGGDPSSSFFRILGGNVGKIPAAAVAFGVATLLIWFIYRKSAFAFSVRAIGSNPGAARLSGFPIGRIRLQVAAFIGLLCAVSGLLSFAFFRSADPSLGNGIELQVIAAAVIGGTGLSGGRGSIPGALLGALIISVIAGGLTQFGVSVNWASLVTGAVIVAAVSLDALVKRRQATVMANSA
jgi:ribose transport system permease protein